MGPGLGLTGDEHGPGRRGPGRRVEHREPRGPRLGHGGGGGRDLAGQPVQDAGVDAAGPGVRAGAPGRCHHGIGVLQVGRCGDHGAEPLGQPTGLGHGFGGEDVLDGTCGRPRAGGRGAVGPGHRRS